MVDRNQAADGNPATANSGMTGIINKLEPFSGGSVGIDVKTFCYYVDEISKIGKWSDTDTASAVRISLRGEAQQYVMLNNNLRTTQTWQDLRQALLERYTPTETPGWNIAKFNQCIQRRGEGVKSYIDRLQQAANKLIVPCENAAEKKIREELHNERLLTQFLEGLLPELRRPVLHNAPKTFKEAQEAAKLAEIVEKQLNEATGEEKQVCNIAVTPQTTTSEGNKYRHNFRRKWTPNRTPPDFSNTMCFLCENIGHISRLCPEKRKNEEPSTAHLTCSRCKKTGHRISQCREKLKDLNSSSLPTNAQVVEKPLSQH